MSAFKEWLIKRGILYGLTQAPIFAVMVGFFFKIAPFHYTNFAVMLAFIILPAWIVYRKNISTDPEEPVHHVHRYALYALFPFAAFSVARIPIMLIFKFPYWHPWFDFGHTLTGEPLNEYASLLPGALLYSLQGFSLGIGFYILFRRHSLVNSLLYLCVFLSSLYCYVFPEYGRVGMPTPPLWHFVGWWAHFWMALVAWYMPIFFERRWPLMQRLGRGLSVCVFVVALSSQYIFAFWETSVWQFPRQHIIDQEVFNRPDLLTLKIPPRLLSLKEEAEFEFVLQLGPRSYKNYINKVRDLEAKNIKVDGEILYQGTPIAWCSGFLSEVSSPNQDQFGPQYLSEIRAMEFASIPVKCSGPSTMKSEFMNAAIFGLKWHATMTLIGDRESVVKEFSGNQTNPMVANL